MRLSEPAIPNILALADAIITAITPHLVIPFALFGHSMGAPLAAEVAHGLAARGLPQPCRLIVSGRRPPRLPDPLPPLSGLSDPDFVAEIKRRYDGIPHEILANPDLLAMLLPALRADIVALETHRPPARPPLNCPISAFGGADDALAPRAHLDAWRDETASTFDVRVFPGGHFYLETERAAVLAQHLRDVRAAARRRSGARGVNAMPAISGGAPVAIVGIGCRFPGGVADAASFWRLMSEGRDAITEIPSDRIDVARYFDPRAATPGRMMTRWGGFLQHIDEFDAGFFGMSPREAERLDPQQRLLLETAWEAFEDAGLDVNRLDGTPTGVFVGQWLSDFEARLFVDPEAVDFYMTTGSGRYAASGRLSYAFGLRGPSLTLDTACSSSLVAIHLAVRSLRDGESQLAIAGGVNVILQPHISIAYSQSRMMAPDGRCKFGDAQGDGYVRSEGAGLVVLKPLDRALADGDRVYAVVRGSATNNDGRSSGSMGTPSALGQEELLRGAYRDAGCSPGDVGYVEAHGTGTRAGDPVELGALGAVLGSGRRSGFKARVGSIKTNLGHTEGAAGVAGLIKVALALHHGRIPASLNCHELNPAVDWDHAPYEIARQAAPWPGERRLGGVSAFGIAGTNAHVVLEQAPVSLTSRGPSSTAQGPCLLPLSARSPEALRALAGAFADLLAAPQAPSMSDVCATAALHRTALEYRAAFATETAGDLIDRLRRFADGEEDAAQSHGQNTQSGGHRLAFVCPGQGAQWRGMTRELIAHESVFRASLERADAALRRHVPWSLMAQLQDDTDDLAERISVVQPVLLAVEIALAELWRSRGVEPQAIVGHSMGEIAAAYIAGVLDLDTAMAIVCRRSALMERTSGNGAMALVELPVEQAAARLRPHGGRASVAVSNSPRSCVISGDPAVVASVIADLERDGIFARLVKVDVASHSPQMDPLVAELVASQSGLCPHTAELTLYSTVDAARRDGTELGADYWGRNLRQTVRFGETIAAMIGDGIDTFIELGPHPTLLNAVRQVAEDRGRDVLALPSLRRQEPERLQLLITIGALFVAGQDIAWRRLFPGGYARVDLPHYPWQRERHWLDIAAPAADSGQRHTFLGASVASSIQPGTYLWNVEIGVGRFPYLADHVVNGATVLPAAVFLDIALEAAGQLRGHGSVQLSEITIETALVLPPSGACLLQIAIEPGPSGSLAFTISSRSGESRDTAAAWTRHACGLIADVANGDLGDQEPAPDATGTMVGADAHYAQMSAHGLAYGPAFRGVRELRKADGVAVATVALPNELSGGHYRVHPTLLDACLQVGVALLPDRTVTDTYVPTAMERLRLLRSVDGAAPLTVRAALRREVEPNGGFVADLVITAADGTPLLDIDRLAFTRLGRSAQPSTENLYAVAWKQSDLALDLPLSRATWSVLTDRQGVGADLATALGAAEVLTFPSGPALREALAGVMKNSGNSGVMHGIVHLWSLDTPLPDGAPDALHAANEMGCLSALTLVQLAATAPSAQRRRLYLVTAGAQAVRDGERPAVAQAPLWGLGRVIANEHPELSCTLIDLSARPTAQEIAALARELGANSSEQQIALRGGERFVARLVRAELAAEPIVTTAAADQQYRAYIATPGILDGLVLKCAPRAAPRPGEVEIEIAATGLNFMNVMSALGICPGYPDGVGPLGIECAGRITAVGDGVDGFIVGDEVMAVALDSLASHATADARLVRKLPAGLSLTEAASIPIAFLTASHALDDLARLERGERVLIHAATGGVGLAALQLARLAGAEIFATAGTDDKRAMLAGLGVKHVMDSRSLAFRDQIMERTRGAGVDVVLNSLSGDFIAAGLAVLAPYGRFVEIGKRDIYQNARIGLAPFQRSLSYFAVDLDRMSRERPAVLAKTFDHVTDLLARGAVAPLPVTAFPISQAADAFRCMAQAAHVGKIVITGHDAAARIVGEAPDRIGDIVAGTCVITGGLGDLGLAVAERLVARGARSLALIGRNAPAANRRDAIRALEAAGATVRVIAADVASKEQMQRTFANMAASLPAISAVFHAAGILDDGVLVQQTAQRFADVMAPKVSGAWNLCMLLADRPEVDLILFSSITSLLGLPGQGSYAAGNAFLDAVALYRTASGGRATSINWGPWRDIGLAAAQSVRGERLAAHGLGGLSPAPALDALERILARPLAEIAVVDADWAAYRSSTGSAKLPFLADLPGGSAEPALPQQQTARDMILAAEPGALRRGAIEAVLKQQVARVLRQSASRIDAAKPFRNLGLDFLMGLELRNRLEAELSLSLPATIVWNYPTVTTLAAHLLAQFEPPPIQAVAAQPEPPADDTEAILREIESLSPEEARRLLAADDARGRLT